MTDDYNSVRDDGAVSTDALKKAEQVIEAEEGAINRYTGALAVFLTASAVVMSLFHLYTAVEIVPAYMLRPIHVAFALVLVFLLFLAAPRFGHRLKG